MSCPLVEEVEPVVITCPHRPVCPLVEACPIVKPCPKPCAPRCREPKPYCPVYEPYTPANCGQEVCEEEVVVCDICGDIGHDYHYHEYDEYERETPYISYTQNAMPLNQRRGGPAHVHAHADGRHYHRSGPVVHRHGTRHWGRTGWYGGRYPGFWRFGHYPWFASSYAYWGPLWYPSVWSPTYIYDDRTGTYMPNPELAVALPTYDLPSFNNVDLSSLQYAQQSLTPQQQVQADSTFAEIDRQLQALKTRLSEDPRAVEWFNRGFEVVPDFDQGNFVWVYTRKPASSISTIGKTMKTNTKLGLACSLHDASAEELKAELARLAHEDILFDIYAKDDKYNGVYIAKDGRVFGYRINIKDGKEEETFIERLPLQLTALQIESLKRRLAALREVKYIYHRYDSPLRYNGFIDGIAVSIYGDDNMDCEEARALAKEIDESIAPVVGQQFS
jgi:hypothetical protein